MERKNATFAANPYAQSNPISRLLCLWTFSIFYKGYKTELESNDLYTVLLSDETQYVGAELDDAWNREIRNAFGEKRQPSLLRAIWYIYRKTFIAVTFIFFANYCIILCAQPIFLKLLIATFNDCNPETWQGFTYASIICITSLLNTLNIQPTTFRIMYAGMKLRIATTSLLYRKCLRLSKASLNQTNSGHIINLLANDVTRFDRNFNFLPFLVIAPLQMCILVYLLYREIGIVSLVAVLIIFLLLPAQYYLGKYLALFRLQLAQRTDERGRIINEIIGGMRVIRQYAWETPFIVLTNSVRKLEIEEIRKRGILRGIHHAVFSFTPKLLQSLVFLIIVIRYTEPLTSEKVFFTLTCLNLLIQITVQFTPIGVTGLGDILVAVKRIQDFLALEEIVTVTPSKSSVIRTIEQNPGFHPGISFENVGAYWGNSDIPALENINLSIKGDTIVTVAGEVGSSKSSLLQVVLRELHVSSGIISINGSLSYASQEPWIFAGNLRQNILVGRKYDEGRYREVIKACALVQDLQQLPNGDLTPVGERGAALSGGQRARVNLARALYKKSDIYLLDDPLSAVDARVSRFLFEKCIKGFLRGSIRILVTQQPQYLTQADHIIVMKKGRIFAQGNMQELIHSGINLVSLTLGEVEGGEGAHLKRSSIISDVFVDKEEATTADEIHEKKDGGSVTLKTYQGYLLSGHSAFGFSLLIAIFLFCQSAISANDYWLSRWTNAETRKQDSETNISQCLTYRIDDNVDSYHGMYTYLYVYSGLSLSVIFFCTLRGIWFYLYCAQTSSTIHEKMFMSLMRAEIRFLDENSSGRIMNRFSKDVNTMDDMLPSAFIDTLVIFLQVVGVIVVVVLSNYYMSVPTLVLFGVLFVLRRIFIRTARDIKRIESVTRSPVFTHVAATIQGLSTIRACQAQDAMIRQFEFHQDTHTSAWFLYLGVNRCFGIWLELICNIFLIFVTFGFLLMPNSAEGGNLGLAISSVLTIMGIFQWGMRQSAEVESHMTSVERVLEYAKLTPEACLESNPDFKPSIGWPEHGAVQFKNVSLTYNTNLQVLKNLTFDVQPSEKIGIVGRTGAGKSSIISALFRLNEFVGDILIDSLAIRDLGLHDLRKNISIIPQDPLLFCGKIRYNLDPFNLHQDNDLWRVLKQVRLGNKITTLDYQVDEGGANFSVGERQLVCLARAILTKNKILVMDEATANIDPASDNFIQNTIREVFADCTVITIAHKLQTIINCNRILVLDEGRLREYDHPNILLQNQNGYFSKMVAQTGQSASVMLKKMAKQSFEDSITYTSKN